MNNILSKTIIDNQSLILGDCLEVIKTFEDKSMDLVITSPPYNIGINYNEYKDTKSLNEYLNWLNKIFIEIKRVLKDNGSIFLNVGSTNTNPWVSIDVLSALRNLFILQNNIKWIKSISVDKDNIFGHFNPVNSKRYLNNTYEDIFHLTKTGDVELDRKAIGVPYKYKVNLKGTTITDDMRCRGNTWFIPYKTIHSKSQRGDHPAVFPEEVVRRCIKLHGYNKDTTVLEPFLGSGTTLMVTRELKCKGTGIEIDKKYFDYAVSKITNTI
jgi:site-specific DNA-methyltransferase (adenine-specific)